MSSGRCRTELAEELQGELLLAAGILLSRAEFVNLLVDGLRERMELRELRVKAVGTTVAFGDERFKALDMAAHALHDFLSRAFELVLELLGRACHVLMHIPCFLRRRLAAGDVLCKKDKAGADEDQERHDIGHQRKSVLSE